MVGSMAAARSPAKTAAEPVFSSTYMDRANFRVKLPSSELLCPRISSVKLRVNRFAFISMDNSFLSCDTDATAFADI